MTHRLISVLVVLSASLGAPPSHAQTLVRDINTQSGSANVGSNPMGLRYAGGYAYFSAFQPATAFEPWRTDGTTIGTLRLGDLVPGPIDSAPGEFAELPSGDVLFAANGFGIGRELWRSDGTPGGTQVLADVHPGLASSSPVRLAPFLGQIAFIASNDVQGPALWRSDGTTAGTARIFDLGAAGAVFDDAVELVVIGTELYFTVSFGGTDWQLWKSGGSTATTVAVTPSPSSTWFPGGLIALNGKLLFTAESPNGRTLWSSDGTAAGTQVVLPPPLPGGFVDSVAPYLGTIGSTLFFAGRDGFGVEPWRTDGTAAGTTRLADLAIFGNDSRPRPLGSTGAKVVFSASTSMGGREPWVTDGTMAGTVPLGDLNPAGDSIDATSNPSLSLGPIVYFSAATPAQGRELWRTDGTPLGTTFVADLVAGPGGSEPSDLAPNPSGGILFAADAGAIGRELWASDGTAAGTVVLKDLAAPTGTGSSQPLLVTRVLDEVFFHATDGTTSALWKSDGTFTGTVQVHGPTAATTPTFPLWLTPVEDRLFFNGTVAAAGAEPWISDGTPSGTFTLGDLRPGSIGSNPLEPARVGDRIFFTADDGAVGRELWVSDGTVAGTTLVADLRPGSEASWPMRLTAVDEFVYFNADVPGAGREPWRSDGTAAGTVMLGDLLPGPTSSHSGSEFVEYQGLVYFAGVDALHGVELWRTDGTAAGTRFVGDAIPGTVGPTPRSFARLGDALLFQGDHPTLPGVHPWVTDGTAAGTRLLLPNPTSGFTIAPNSTFAVLAGDVALFTAHDQGANDMIWRTDGTPAGTTLVSAPSLTGTIWELGPLASGPNAIFRGHDFSNGAEPWTSDGTAGGTTPLLDVAPGSAGSGATRFERAGKYVFFAADDGSHGIELHAFPVAAAGDYVSESLGGGCAGSSGVVPSVAVQGTPIVGAAFGIQLQGAAPSAFSLLFIGLEVVDLDAGAGCRLHVDGPLAVGLTTNGAGGISIGYVPVAALVGLPAVIQFAVSDAGGALSGIASLSDGYELVFGL